MSLTTVSLNKNTIYQFLEQVDPGSGFLDFRYPVDVWNYIIYCLPFVLFVITVMFVHIPIVLHFLHWAPKLLWPRFNTHKILLLLMQYGYLFMSMKQICVGPTRLMGFPLLHELLRRLTQLTNPQPPSAGDFIRYFERLYNFTNPEHVNSSNSSISLTSLVL